MTKPIVLHVCAVEYSARTLLVPQLSFLASHGFEVRLACASDGTTFGDALGPFNPSHIDFPRQRRLRAMRASAQQLGELIGELRPDLVHLHSPAAAMCARLLPLRVLRRQPLVYTVHGFPFQWNRRLVGSGGVTLLAELWQSRRTAMMLFQSKEDLRRAGQFHFGSKLRYLGNGVQDHWFDVPARSRKGPLELLFIGRLVREKGIVELLEALRLTDGVTLRVAGTRIESERDDIRPEIERLVSDPKMVGRVKLLGHVDQSLLPALMQDVDAVVLPSYREGVPRSIIEAMASGRPVIATDVRGCRELVTDGANGWLVPARDVDELAGALRSASEASPERLASLGAAGRAVAWTTYRESAVFDRLVAAYSEFGLVSRPDVILEGDSHGAR